MGQPGRIRERVAALLRAQGLRIEAADIVPARGYWRSSRYVDVHRWGAWARAGTAVVPHHYEGCDPFTYAPDTGVEVCSWDTLTRCARGLYLYHDPGDVDTQIMVAAKA